MPKFKITRYDKRIKNLPFRAVKPFDEFELPESFEDPTDELGERRYATLVNECAKRGHKFKFYTGAGKPGEYEIFVL